MRIVSGGVQHETNTFASTPTTLADFIRDSECGPELSGYEVIVERYRGTGCIHGGYIAGAEALGIELLPLLSARAQPSGVVQQQSLDTMLGWFLERLEAAMPVDGVLLDLHGAMVSEAHEDAEGAFIEAVRQLVGPDLPVVVTLDLHANITQQMVDLTNVIIGFDTYPHVDMHERGREAIELLARIIRGDILPVQAYRQLPLVTMPPMQCTLREPMQSLIQRLHRLEDEAGILTATVSMGFPFADIRDAGVSVLVTTDRDEDLANRKVDELASWLWDLRDDLTPKLTSIEEVMQFVDDHPDDGLTLVADGSDNPGGGAPCDGTVALHAMIEVGFQGGAVGVLFDPETAAQAHQAGVGKTIHVRLGGKTDDKHGAPVTGDAYVRSLSDGSFVHQGPMFHGVLDHLGPTATLVIGGVEVVVASQRRQCLDVEMLRIAGIEPTHRRLLVVKSAVHFRADFGPLAAHIFDADTPGIHRPDFAMFNYRRLREPIYPLHEQAAWPPRPQHL
ncbi:MAG: M81 family metallopeptidase [Pirellulaceae bacterium]|jgi:microcystin degradation protein MlrC|nr:M81 family metallopeptidase [Pirellulaceae bacterium]MDP6719381.1 M81 family metallopeptidase [Pirellulaceae bacterium]